jgi:hypothetical protein
MMNGKRALITVCAVAASFSHVNADAASGMDGLEACASALAREISTEQGAGLQVRISDDSIVPNYRLNNYTLFHLDARDPRTREIVAKMDCSVDARARVKRLVRLPDDAPDAADRSL